MPRNTRGVALFVPHTHADWVHRSCSSVVGPRQHLMTLAVQGIHVKGNDKKKPLEVTVHGAMVRSLCRVAPPSAAAQRSSCDGLHA